MCVCVCEQAHVYAFVRIQYTFAFVLMVYVGSNNPLLPRACFMYHQLKLKKKFHPAHTVRLCVLC